MGFVGSMIAPWIFGRLLDLGDKSSASYFWGFVMLAAFGVAALVSMALFKESKKRPAPRQGG
jgi:MFS family permease